MRLPRALASLTALLSLAGPAAPVAQETRCDRGDVEVATLGFQGNTAFPDAQLEADSLKRHRVQLGDELLAAVEKQVGKGNVRLHTAGWPGESEAFQQADRTAEKLPG